MVERYQASTSFSGTSGRISSHSSAIPEDPAKSWSIEDREDLVTCHRALPSIEGEAPKKFACIPAGEEIVGKDGRSFRNENPEATVEIFNRACPVMIDYEHESENPYVSKAPAAGWVNSFTLEGGETVANEVEWTPNGGKSVAGKEWRFVSPAIYHDKDGNLLGISSNALTNRPNLKLKSLNRENPKKEDGMDPKLLKALGLSEGATPEEALKALNSIKEQAAVPSPEKFVPRADYNLALNRAEKAEDKATKAEGLLAEHREETRKAEIDKEIKLALNDAKIAPASEEHYRKMCAMDGGLELFRELVKTSPKIIGEGKAPEGPHDGKSVSLNKAESEILEGLGVSKETYELGAN